MSFNEVLGFLLGELLLVEFERFLAVCLKYVTY
jgi:hypothetical protein